MIKNNNPDKREAHPLAPFLPRHAGLLMLGSFPPPVERWTLPFYYPNFQNDMWRIFGLVFFDDRHHFISAGNRSFDEESIRRFLTAKGIALYDTATEVIRQKGNASDRFLTIVRTMDLPAILARIPYCGHIAVTGQKAAETLMSLLGVRQLPPIGGCIDTDFADRQLRLWRMPSSSRAYPRALPDKADDYRRMFQALRLTGYQPSRDKGRGSSGDTQPCPRIL